MFQLLSESWFVWLLQKESRVMREEKKGKENSKKAL